MRTAATLLLFFGQRELHFIPPPIVKIPLQTPLAKSEKCKNGL